MPHGRLERQGENKIKERGGGQERGGDWSQTLLPRDPKRRSRSGTQALDVITIGNKTIKNKKGGGKEGRGNEKEGEDWPWQELPR